MSQVSLYLYEDKCSHLYMMKEVNFLEDPRPAVPRHLVNDLDRILHIGVDVDAGLHDGVGALSQHLPSQPVELLEGVGGERGGARGLLLPLPSVDGGLLPGHEVFLQADAGVAGAGAAAARQVRVQELAGVHGI